VQASLSPGHVPQAALVGIVVTDAFELVFNTPRSTRKAHNLRVNPAVAFVIGGWGDDPRSVQYEGVVDEPHGAELERLKAQYLRVFPEGTTVPGLPGLAYFRARPTWIRYSDYSTQPPTVVEFSLETLAR